MCVILALLSGLEAAVGEGGDLNHRTVFTALYVASALKVATFVSSCALVVVAIIFLFILFIYFYNCIVPLGFLPCEIRICFPRGKPAATESRYPTYGACCVFECFHSIPNSNLDYRIFNVPLR